MFFLLFHLALLGQGFWKHSLSFWTEPEDLCIWKTEQKNHLPKKKHTDWNRRFLLMLTSRCQQLVFQHCYRYNSPWKSVLTVYYLACVISFFMSTMGVRVLGDLHLLRSCRGFGVLLKDIAGMLVPWRCKDPNVLIVGWPPSNYVCYSNSGQWFMWLDVDFFHLTWLDPFRNIFFLCCWSCRLLEHLIFMRSFT